MAVRLCLCCGLSVFDMEGETDMSVYSNEYKCIRKQAEDWPEWKKIFYNCCIAISAHAVKLPVNKEKTE